MFTDSAAAVLEFREVVKSFGAVCAVDHITFSVERGEIFTLLGPSGCGKTTTLRLVAGLEEPNSGEICIAGTAVAAPERRVFLAPEKRQLGMVFQSYAIWPHLTVFENVAFPLRVRREPATVLRQRVHQALEAVGLGGFAERGATQLSGGQQQRVALARALVYEPALLLLDEPLSNLDAKLREQMRVEIRALQRRLGLTVLYVTHDQTEAMTLSDRIAVVNQGCFEQVGAPEQLYETPATAFVAEFLGRTVSLAATIARNHAGCWLEFAGNAGRSACAAAAAAAFEDGATVRVLMRPEDVEILGPGDLADGQVAATVDQVAYLGERYEYQVRTAGDSIVLAAPKKIRLHPGDPVRLALDSARIKLRAS
jgi:ABC-type Fe3+/spermidine/putrescine transport system ATPase subunit